jgi:NADPH:quinone reductase-like Zn-dependent oxidoreductase
MKSLCLTQYGSLDFFRMMELAEEVPGAQEIQIQVFASALNPSDFKVALGEVKFLRGRRFPMTLGNDFSGVVSAIGESVTDFRIGDSVFGFLPYGPFNQRGAFAQKLVVRTNWVARKAPNIPHTIAAASATAGLTALQALRDIGKLKPGGRVLITGASGGVGSAAIQVALKLGASEVVVVGSGKGLDLAKKLGATSVIDRKSEDVFAAVSERFDIIFDAAAAYRWSQWKHKLQENGAYITTLPSTAFALDKVISFGTSSSTNFVSVKPKSDDLKILAGWLESGLTVPIDATVPISDIPQALARLQRGEVLGKIAVEAAF